MTSGAASGIGWRCNGGGSISVEEWEHRRSKDTRDEGLVYFISSDSASERKDAGMLPTLFGMELTL